jgi:hypothetical protein
MRDINFKQKVNWLIESILKNIKGSEKKKVDVYVEIN